MNQIPEHLQTHLNDTMIMQMNQNMNIINPPNMTQILPNPQNLPLNQNMQMGLTQQMVNNPQNDDTSKI